LSAVAALGALDEFLDDNAGDAARANDLRE